MKILKLIEWWGEDYGDDENLSGWGNLYKRNKKEIDDWFKEVNKMLGIDVVEEYGEIEEWFGVGAVMCMELGIEVYVKYSDEGNKYIFECCDGFVKNEKGERGRMVFI